MKRISAEDRLQKKRVELVHKRGFECWQALCRLQVAMVAANRLSSCTPLFKELETLTSHVQELDSWNW